MPDQITHLLSLTPSKLSKLLPTMNIAELENLDHRMTGILMSIIDHHHHCRTHHISIPNEMLRLEKNWSQSLPMIKLLLQERTNNNNNSNCDSLLTA